MNSNEFHADDLATATTRIPWSINTDDLQMNVVVLRSGEEISSHTNDVLDVIMTCLRGTGTLVINKQNIAMAPLSIVRIPLGSTRRIVAGPEGITYTTTHRRRSGLMPEMGLM